MRFLLLSAFALSLSLASAASAQAVWRARGPSVSLDVAKYLETDGGTVTDEQGNSLGDVRIGTFETLQTLSARVPVGQVRVVAELPLALADSEFGEFVDEPSGGYTGYSIGNPYLGIEAQVGAFGIGLGLRAPLAVEQAYYVGFLTDAERPEATIPNHASATLSVDGTRAVHPNVRIRVRLAPTLLAYTGEEIRLGGGPDSEFGTPDPWLAVAFGADVEASAGRVALSLGWSGTRSRATASTSAS